jgi:O-antigen ligase
MAAMILDEKFEPAEVAALAGRPAIAAETVAWLAPPRREHSLRALLRIRPWRTDVAIVIAYIVVTRIGSLAAAKVGIQIGPVPLFLTDLTMLALLGLAVIKRPGRLLFWISSGTQAGAIGFAVWMLVALDVVYFLVAFPAYGIFAARDFAIFAYSMFFPLTYWVISNRTWAVRATRYFVYAGVVLGVLMLIQAGTGIDLGFGILRRRVFGIAIDYVGNDDFGGILAFSLVGLAAYLLLERSRRTFHLAAAVVCFVALAATGTRSAFVGAALAGVLMFLLLSNRYRLGFTIFASALAAALILGATLPTSLPGAHWLHDFYLAIASAAGGQSDMNAAYRLARWKDAVGTWLGSPVLGVGFGRDILHQIYIGDWQAGKFNLGMPHNTYLFVLARMGVIGFALIAFAIASAIARLSAAVRRFRLADDLAALNMLVAMTGFAAFVLFFERPMNNAAFWILLAVAMRLAETSRQGALARILPRRPPPLPLDYQRTAALAATMWPLGN